MSSGCDTECREMRGLLSFLILFLLSKRELNGDELACELERRRGVKPNPGTIYPALKELLRRGHVVFTAKGKQKVYRLTPSGLKSLKTAVALFKKTFSDVFACE